MSVGVSKSALASYERGESEPTASALAAYHQKFKVNLAWLVTGDGEMFSEGAEASAPKTPVDIVLVDELGRMVLIECKSVGRRLLPEQVSVETMKLYNELALLVNDIHDQEEVQAFLPQVRYRLKKRLSEEQDAPGSGKRSA